MTPLTFPALSVQTLIPLLLLLCSLALLAGPLALLPLPVLLVLGAAAAGAGVGVGGARLGTDLYRWQSGEFLWVPVQDLGRFT